MQEIVYIICPKQDLGEIWDNSQKKRVAATELSSISLSIYTETEEQVGEQVTDWTRQSTWVGMLGG